MHTLQLDTGKLMDFDGICITTSGCPKTGVTLKDCLFEQVLVTTPAPSLLRDGSRCGSGCNSGFNYWIQREDGRIVLGGFRDQEGVCHTHSQYTLRNLQLLYAAVIGQSQDSRAGLVAARH